MLDNSALHFVRCFKPNDAKKGGDWQDDVILRQLHTSVDLAPIPRPYLTHISPKSPRPSSTPEVLGSTQP